MSKEKEKEKKNPFITGDHKTSLPLNLAGTGVIKEIYEQISSKDNLLLKGSLLISTNPNSDNHYYYIIPFVISNPPKDWENLGIVPGATVFVQGYLSNSTTELSTGKFSGITVFINNFALIYDNDKQKQEIIASYKDKKPVTDGTELKIGKFSGKINDEETFDILDNNKNPLAEYVPIEILDVVKEYFANNKVTQNEISAVIEKLKSENLKKEK